MLPCVLTRCPLCLSFAEYVCTAFPDDAYVTDQMLVGLISVAVALPVDLFLARAFELANEGDAPESWLEAPAGKWKWVVGKNGHNDWRLNDPKVPISDLVLWLIRYGEEPIYAIVFRLIAWLRRKLRAKLYGPEPEPEEEKEEEDDASAASREARADAITKRLYASLGLLGVYMCWTIFAWCVAGSSIARCWLSARFLTHALLHLAAGSSSPTACLFTRRWATARSSSLPRCALDASSRHVSQPLTRPLCFPSTDVGHWLRCVSASRLSCRCLLALSHALPSRLLPQAWTTPPSGRRCSKPQPRPRSS